MIKYYNHIEQRSPEWYALRCGNLTASEMKHAISRKTDRKTGEITYKTPDDDKAVAHLYELAAQRANNYVEPTFQSFDMLRGIDDELDAKRYYEENYEPVKDCGFITNDKWGFTLGYSPDGLVGDDGLIEAKGRIQKYQMETIVTGLMPAEYEIQVQSALLVSERKWIDFISFSGGMPMKTIRVVPDEKVQSAILAAATAFNTKLDGILSAYKAIIADSTQRLVPTERRPPDDEIKGSAA